MFIYTSISISIYGERRITYMRRARQSARARAPTGPDGPWRSARCGAVPWSAELLLLLMLLLSLLLLLYSFVLLLLLSLLSAAAAAAAAVVVLERPARRVAGAGLGAEPPDLGLWGGLFERSAQGRAYDNRAQCRSIGIPYERAHALSSYALTI